MPSLPGRAADFISKHGSMERDHPEVTGTIRGGGTHHPCPGCGVSIPTALCTECAVAEVARWKAEREAARVPKMDGWASGRVART